MSIKKVTDSKGRVRYRVQIYDSLRKKGVYVGTCDRRKDAEELEHEAKRRLRLGESVKPKPPREEITFNALAKRWIVGRANIRRSTRVDYENALRRLRPLVGSKLVSEITRKDVDVAVSSLARDFAPSTCRKTMVVFSMVMKAGIAWDHLDRSPTYGQRLALPKVRKRRFEPLSNDDVNKLIDAVPEYWRPAFLVLFTVAPRRSELFGLELRNLNLEERTLLIRYQLHKGRLVEPKSDAAVRRVILPARTVEALRAHVASVPESELGLLFPTERGRPVDPDSWFHRVWQPAREAAGLPDLRIHDARHHLASLLLSQGRSVKYVQRTMGHATASILLDVYAWVTRHEEEEAVSDLDRWMGEEEPAAYGLRPRIRVTQVIPEARCQCLAA